MKIEMQQRERTRILKCKHCGSDDLNPDAANSVSGVDAVFLNLDVTCAACGKTHKFRWTNQVILREITTN